MRPGLWPLPEIAGARRGADVVQGLARVVDEQERGAPRGEELTRGLTLELLFARHADQVFRIVASLLGPGASRADVQDLTQQVFLAAHRALPRFRGESAPLTWLYGIASRTVLMHLRKWGRQRRLLEALERQPESTADLEATVIERDQLRRVWRALLKVSPKKRIVYVMFEIEGLSGREIALALGLPEATVRTRLLHARRELECALAREGVRR